MNDYSTPPEYSSYRNDFRTTSRLSFDYKLTKAHGKEFFRLHNKVTHRGWIFLLLSLLFFLIGMALIYFFGDIVEAPMCFVSLLFFALAVFPSGFSLASSKKGQEVIHCDLREDGIHESLALESAVYRYEGITKLVSSTNLYAVYIDKRVAHLYPKEAISPQGQQIFEEVLQAKTGLVMKRVNIRKNYPLRLLAFLGFAALWALGIIGALMLHDSQPATYTGDGGFSIVLPGDVILDEEEMRYEYDFSAYNADTVIWAFRDDECSPTEMTLEEYAMDSADLEEVDRSLVKQYPDGTWRMGFEAKVDEEFTGYYYVVMAQAGSDFWYITFGCAVEDRPTYESVFAQWADTIQIDASAAGSDSHPAAAA